MRKRGHGERKKKEKGMEEKRKHGGEGGGGGKNGEIHTAELKNITETK